MTTTSSRPQSPEAYRTLENNLKKARFKAESSFRWLKNVEGVAVIVEFLCETGQVTGSCFGAFNVRGAQLVTRGYVEREIEADRLDDGGHSKVVVRVANILPNTVLKILAFQDRHENKDSYDLIYCLLNFGEGPDDAGQAAPQSTIRGDAQVEEALRLLAERFADVDQDGPHAYGTFLADEGDTEEAARLRQEAVAVVREFLAAMQ